MTARHRPPVTWRAPAAEHAGRRCLAGPGLRAWPAGRGEGRSPRRGEAPGSAGRPPTPGLRAPPTHRPSEGGRAAALGRGHRRVAQAGPGVLRAPAPLPCPDVPPRPRGHSLRLRPVPSALGPLSHLSVEVAETQACLAAVFFCRENKPPPAGTHQLRYFLHGVRGHDPPEGKVCDWKGVRSFHSWSLESGGRGKGQSQKNAAPEMRSRLAAVTQLHRRLSSAQCAVQHLGVLGPADGPWAAVSASVAGRLTPRHCARCPACLADGSSEALRRARAPAEGGPGGASLW